MELTSKPVFTKITGVRWKSVSAKEAYKWHIRWLHAPLPHVVKTRRIPKIDAVYREFKAYLVEQDSAVELVLADIHAHAGHYAAMALEQEADPSLATAFADLRELQVDVAYPLLLELYHDYRQSVRQLSPIYWHRLALPYPKPYVLRRAQW